MQVSLRRSVRRLMAFVGLLVASATAPLRADVLIVPPCAGTGSAQQFDNNGDLTFLNFLPQWCTGSPNFLPNFLFIGPLFPGGPFSPTTTMIVENQGLFVPRPNFGIFSIDIAPEFFALPIAGPLTFIGAGPNGVVTQTFQFTASPGALVTRFYFNSDFANLTSLQFPAQGSLGGLTPIYQFGNITYSLTPEPSEVVLFATGLLVLAGFHRARRRRPSVMSR